MDDSDDCTGTTRRAWLRRTGGLAGVTATAGCLGRVTDLVDSDGPLDSGREEIPHDVSVDHDPTTWERYDAEWQAPTGAPPGGYGVTTLAENLAIPWDLSFAPTGELFLTERTGRLLRFEAGRGESVAAPEWVIDAGVIDPGSDESAWRLEGGEGGLLGTAVHPSYPDPPLVYLYYTTETDERRENRVVAVDVEDGRSWNVVTGIPADVYHNGGRIEFGPANYLWVTTGDADPGIENPDRIADPGNLAGAVLRVAPDGTPPSDTPAIDGGDPRVYTYGHRNPQGVAWLPDATPLAAEHGPNGGDEVNVLRPGADYGWPRVRHADGFDGYAGTDYRPPVATSDHWAPAGCLFYTGSAVPSLRNRLLVGCLHGQRVVATTLYERGRRVPTDHDRLHDWDWADREYDAGTDSLLVDEIGRIRHLEQGPDGGLYAVTSNRDGRAREGFPTDRDDRLVRIDSPGDA